MWQLAEREKNHAIGTWTSRDLRPALFSSLCCILPSTVYCMKTTSHFKMMASWTRYRNFQVKPGFGKTRDDSGLFVITHQVEKCCYEWHHSKISHVAFVWCKCICFLFQVIACPDTMERLILVASNCLGLTATHVFTAQGGRIDDASLIRYVPSPAIIRARMQKTNWSNDILWPCIILSYHAYAARKEVSIVK